MIYRFPVEKVKNQATLVPDGRAAYLLARGKIEGDELVFDDVLLNEAKEKISFEPESFRAKIPLVTISAKFWPPGFGDMVKSLGKLEGDSIFLDMPAIAIVAERFPEFTMDRQLYREMLKERRQTRLSKPGVTKLATNFTGAMAVWAKSGFKMVDEQEFDRRLSICVVCEFWNPKGMMGLGTCKKCGCSRYKLKLATSVCPDKPARWGQPK